ncbi:transposase [Gordonia amicalis]|uniref:Transposase n=2 Tax=Gordonia TaxID=2053 RepID=A0AAE4U1S2_9ACTN|nr:MULTISPECIES: transposase [Gordonia]MCZ4579267.1 transposase [Gordonia amicalis]MCZ4653807.1 transposase [Gordonia amicalis]MDJ0455508.1 transposase [Gordonia amicalis]MDV6310269.1 transposase [Gordonia amicalis]MDV6314254.1 transposase [Gordonia amicalis]
MAAPRKYSVELKERATRMAVEARQDSATRPGALKRIAEQLGVHPEALRTWVKQAEVDGGVRPGTTSSDAERIAQLERENRELRRANTILKQTVICHCYGTAWIATRMGPPWRVIEDALRGWVGQVRVGVVGGRRGLR